MKMQLTALAAAVSIAMSASSLAQTMQSNVDLEYESATSPQQGGGWGVNNENSNALNIDDNAWDNSNFGAGDDTRFQTFTDSLGSMDPSTVISGENTSFIRQETQAGGAQFGNMASVMQKGDQNYSNVDQNKQQSGDALEADVYQNGEGNSSIVKQDLSFGAVANVYQYGDRNLSKVDQFGADNNGSDVNQTGNDNRSIVVQGTNPGGATGNNTFVQQNGDSNQSYVFQQWHNNTAMSDQFGDNGMSQIWQAGSGNEAKLKQEAGSELNTSYILQGQGGVSDNNLADVTQDGNNNESYVSQLVGDGNEAFVKQTGSYGDSTILQSGALNYANVEQSGVGDISFITQEGSNNEANVTQKGLGIAGQEFNESFILQTGGGSHIATVNQDHAPAGGWNNISTITQISANQGNATVTQVGSGNRASTIQY